MPDRRLGAEGYQSPAACRDAQIAQFSMPAATRENASEAVITAPGSDHLLSNCDDRHPGIARCKTTEGLKGVKNDHLLCSVPSSGLPRGHARAGSGLSGQVRVLPVLPSCICSQRHANGDFRINQATPSGAGLQAGRQRSYLV
jgi:hypothetical protein